MFLVDFALNLRRSRPRANYFIKQRGWLDLLGSIPSFGFFEFTALFRLARLSRLARIARVLRGKNKKQLVQDVVRNRGEYAAFVTVLLAFLVLVLASVLVPQFESQSPDANIITGGDALWWAVVTITTVGYGDFYPVTAGGRLTGLFVMFAGVGVIDLLAPLRLGGGGMAVVFWCDRYRMSISRSTAAASRIARRSAASGVRYTFRRPPS